MFCQKCGCEAPTRHVTFHQNIGLLVMRLYNGTDGQLLNVGYGCFPVVDPSGEAVPGWGREFVIAANLPTGGATWQERDRILARYYRAIIERIVDGRI